VDLAARNEVNKYIYKMIDEYVLYDKVFDVKC